MNPWLVALVGVLTIAVGTLGGLPVTTGVLRLAARSRDAGPREADTGEVPAPGAPTEEDGDGAPGDVPAEAAAAGDGGPTSTAARAALRGGTWIGLLERATVTGGLLLGYPTAVAFVIAVKGLGRYPELRDNPAASERFVIGSMASLVWASAVGIAGAAVIGA